MNVTPLPTQSSLLSRLCWYWLWNVIRIGQKRDLSLTDLQDIDASTESKFLLNQFLQKWKETSTNKYRWINIIYTDILGGYKYALLVLSPIIDTICYLLSIEFMRQILIILQANSNLYSIYYFIIGIVICRFIMVIYDCSIRYVFEYYGIIVSKLINAIIIHKSLMMHENSFDSASVINIITSDAQRLIYLSYRFPHGVPKAMYSSLMIIYLCYIIDSYLPLIGLFYLILYAVIQIFCMSKLYQKLRAKVIRITDRRIKFIQDALKSWLILKVYCTQSTLYNKIKTIRQNEVKYIKYNAVINVVNDTVNDSLDIIVILIIIIPYLYINDSVSPTVIFPVLAVFFLLRDCFCFYIPYTVQHYNELKVSIERITDFLSTPNINVNATYKCNNDAHEKPFIKMNNISFSWDKIIEIQNMEQKEQKEEDDAEYDSCNPLIDDVAVQLQNCKVHLKNICLNVTENTLMGITGEIGSGKTSLLHSILGEIPIYDINDHNDYIINGQIGLVSQTPFILPITIRDNILFGNEYDVEWYNTVIQACCLVKDLESYPSNDRTIIGESGINLSGGQNTRVNLARVIYSKPNILLLDNTLNNLDQKTALMIFNNLFDSSNGLMKNTIRIFITHSKYYLSKCDQVKQMKKGMLCELILSQNVMDMENGKNVIVNDKKFINASKSMKLYEDNDDKNISIVKKENVESGSISFQTYKSLLSKNNSTIVTLLSMFTMVIVCVIAQGLLTFTEYIAGTLIYFDKDNIYFYLVISFIMVCMFIIRGIVFKLFIINGSKYLHNKTLFNVLNASMTFYEDNPFGRILNRFSKDIMMSDDYLHITSFFMVIHLIYCFAILILFGFVSIYLYILAIPLLLIVIYIWKLYINCANQCQRLNGITQSIVINSVNNIYKKYALSTIRSLNKQSYFISNTLNVIDVNTKTMLYLTALNSWMAFYVTMFSLFFVFIFLLVTCYLYVNTQQFANTIMFGLIIKYAIIILEVLPFSVIFSARTQNIMIHVERLHQYNHIEMEHLSKKSNGCDNKIKSGGLIFENVSVKYRDYLTYHSLKNISFKINDGEKICIIGRTGSGKSTLFNTLLGLIKIENISGNIYINGINYNILSLSEIRNIFCIIPQNCIIFNGLTIKYNLDPFNIYSDKQIIESLKDVKLWYNLIDKYEHKIYEKISQIGTTINGKKISYGQIQLLCVARALLTSKTTKILLIDEGTSNMDNKNETIINGLLQTKFNQKTILTISHKLNLNNVKYYDKIMVFDDCELKQFDTFDKLDLK